MKIENSFDFMEEEYIDGTQFIKESNKYLVFARNCTWSGASGYKFANSFIEAIYRSYDCSIYPVERSKGKKTLICKEYHHDVPMGHTSIIVALTDKEYEELNRCNNFEAIQRFAEEKERAV